MHASLSEILLILLVALLFIKPEKLPDAALTMGRWLKWFRQSIIKIKQEVEEPLKQLSSEQVDNERK